ncbi:glycine receptor subunit alpha-1-like [Stegodyphus dumicola]|uniref:glycine receptor subunit alpha-1-like n=1 Tax=Stegodyphus dumicola TaxID=202533 RepID=UPI0015AE7303|nr:glycine receptor subunit alpha-1-like [Stegodyphus dumicola]
MTDCYKRLSFYLKALCVVLCVTFSLRAEDNERVVEFSDVAPPEYDYLSPPMIDGKPVHVNVSISKLNIRTVDESDMSFSVVIELWQEWNDHRLQYPSWAIGNIQILDSSWMTKLWTPNLYFLNSVDGKLDNVIMPSSFFWLTRNLNIIYCCRVVLKLICEMDLVYFPHDEQFCGIQMASGVCSTLGSTLYSEYNLFNVEGCGKIKIILNYYRNILLSHLDNLSCLEETIHLRRRSGYYLINVYIQTVLIVIMSMLTFWIPPDAVPARVTLGVTSLLTIITKQYQAQMPNVSYIVALNVWLSCCIAFVFFSLLEFAVVIALSRTSMRKSYRFHSRPESELPMVLLKANGKWSMKNAWALKAEKEESPIPT